jgi:double-stranded uracil-DNA glycosylase
MAEFLRFSPELPYAQRVDFLKKNGIALWNVCGVASRRVSSIRAMMACPNDFAGFLALHTGIRLVLFNGVEAKRIYNHQVRVRLPNTLYCINSECLPSTSPRCCAISYEQKLSEWSAALTRANLRHCLPISK